MVTLGGGTTTATRFPFRAGPRNIWCLDDVNTQIVADPGSTVVFYLDPLHRLRRLQHRRSGLLRCGDPARRAHLRFAMVSGLRCGSECLRLGNESGHAKFRTGSIGDGHATVRDWPVSNIGSDEAERPLKFPGTVPLTFDLSGMSRACPLEGCLDCMSECERNTEVPSSIPFGFHGSFMRKLGCREPMVRPLPAALVPFAPASGRINRQRKK
jgi:hypothetical protein